MNARVSWFLFVVISSDFLGLFAELMQSQNASFIRRE